MLEPPAAEAARPGEPSPDAPREPTARELRARLRRAARERRRVEVAEVRRFTRSARRRRQLLAGSAVTVLVVLGVPVGLALSPAFAVRAVVVEGGSPAVTTAVRDRLAGLAGTPLALVDPGAVRRAVAAVPQVATYRAASLPPGTLEVRLVERTPVGQLDQGGSWAVVDAAGVVLATADARVAGRPLLAVPASGPRFAAAVGVLQALPADVRAQVTAVSAPGVDDVRLRLTSGLKVEWGSAEAAAAKGAALRAALRRVAKGAAVVDVSAPGLVTVR